MTWGPYIFLMVEVPSGEHLGAVLVKINGYQEAISIGAFAHGGRGRKAKLNRSILDHRCCDEHRGILYSYQHADEYAGQQKVWAETVARLGLEPRSVVWPDPTKTFDSPQAFYDQIHYDRVKKRFRPPGSTS